MLPELTALEDLFASEKAWTPRERRRVRAQVLKAVRTAADRAARAGDRRARPRCCEGAARDVVGGEEAGRRSTRRDAAHSRRRRRRGRAAGRLVRGDDDAKDAALAEAAGTPVPRGQGGGIVLRLTKKVPTKSSRRGASSLRVSLCLSLSLETDAGTAERPVAARKECVRETVHAFFQAALIDAFCASELAKKHHLSPRARGRRRRRATCRARARGHARRFRARFIFYAPPQTRRRARGRAAASSARPPRLRGARPTGAETSPATVRSARGEACVSAERWASTRALDERVAHDRLSAAVESDVNFVDAGFPPTDVRGDAHRAVATTKGRAHGRIACWAAICRVGAFRGPRLPASVRGGVRGRRAERTAVAVDPKRAYRSVDDAIDRLLLSTGAEWIGVLRRPRGSRGRAGRAARASKSERITFNGIRGEDRRRIIGRHAYNNKRVVNVFEEPFTTAMGRCVGFGSILILPWKA